MNRCMHRRAALAFAVAAALAGSLPLTPVHAQAQGGFVREAPKDVVLGQLTVTQPPEVTIDGKTERLSPGARIRDTNNMMVLSGALAGKTVPVVYRREPLGLVHDVWILTPDEYSRLSTGASGSNGAQRFAELLSMIFGLRR